MTIPSSVDSISGCAFCSCFRLKSISVAGNNLNFISEDGVLFNKGKTRLLQFPCGKNTEYAVPNSVTTLVGSSFRGCKKQSRVSIPDSVKVLGSFTFKDTGLTTVTVPSSVENIGNGTFAYCPNLLSIEVEANNTNFTSVNGVLYDKSVNKLFQFPAGMSVNNFTFPVSVNELGYCSFAGSNLITNITIPSRITTIGREAFKDCKNLAYLEYLGTTEVDHDIRVFSGCGSLKFICFPKEYNDTTFCDETGIGFSTNCETLKEDENECYFVSPIDGEWKVQMKEEFAIWNNQTDSCVEYKCDNNKGLYAESICPEDTQCVNENCTEETDIEGDYVITVEFEDDVNVAFISTTTIIAYVSDKTNVDCNSVEVSVVFNPIKENWNVQFFVKGESDATSIASSLINDSSSYHIRSVTSTQRAKAKELSLSGAATADIIIV